jgi:hypothetical protein
LFAVVLALFFPSGTSVAAPVNDPARASALLRELGPTLTSHPAPTTGLAVSVSPGETRPGEAVRQTHAAPRTVELRHSVQAIPLFLKGGPSTGQPLRGLPRAAGRCPDLPRASLRILFCTWLT